MRGVPELDVQGDADAGSGTPCMPPGPPCGGHSGAARRRAWCPSGERRCPSNTKPLHVPPVQPEPVTIRRICQSLCKAGHRHRRHAHGGRTYPARRSGSARQEAQSLMLRAGSAQQQNVARPRWKAGEGGPSCLRDGVAGLSEIAIDENSARPSRFLWIKDRSARIGASGCTALICAFEGRDEHSLPQWGNGCG